MAASLASVLSRCLVFVAISSLWRTTVFAHEEFKWETILPTEELIWIDCYSGNQCARLKVPLDYSHPEDAAAAIAIIRVHSRVPHDSPEYRGPVLINPGGPGGSGVDTVLTRGSQFSTILGPEFDIVGFDPRGISRSTPRVSFFETRVERKIWAQFRPSKISMNASADALPSAWARSVVQGRLARASDDGSLRFINTDHTARDMLRIVQAHSREKLQYWGFSYGSILGATFASMFPENVGRLVVDGVVDPEDYFETEWFTNLIDTENAWMSFVDGCVAAGPRGCAFFSPTSEAILENLEKIYASLRKRPIPVWTKSSFGVVDYSRLRWTIFRSLYQPYAKFPKLAQALADLSIGDGTALFEILESPPFECECDPSAYGFESVSDGVDAVLCNDGKQISPDYEDFMAHHEKVAKLSQWADMWPPRMACVAWPDFPKNHFRGPFTANTSFPILLVGNTADPVTPLWAAKKMSQGFTGSVVLTQDSAGHTSLSAPSVCTPKHVRQYFLAGTLPEPDTACPVIGSLFPLNDHNSVAAADVQAVLSLSAEDRNLLDAIRELAMTFDLGFP
ncbi:TAP-like protein-domain-containing protein [Mycena polygramma]|nr:TAP-like protein-domain-containing protein [Mycena polygramma]